MAKTIDETLSIEMNAGAVRSRMSDPDLLPSIAMASGADHATAAVDDEGVVTVIRRIQVPAAARAMVHGDSIEVVERRRWVQFGADVTITVTDLAVEVTGQVLLEEHGARCIVHLRATAVAHMGFASPLAEGLIRDKLIEQFRAEVETLRG